MDSLLNKELKLSKKGTDGKWSTVAWIKKSEKYDNLDCSISVEGMKKLLETVTGKYVYCSVFIDDAKPKEEAKPEPAEEAVSDDIPF